MASQNTYLEESKQINGVLLLHLPTPINPVAKHAPNISNPVTTQIQYVISIYSG
jgi:hypothetical protein